jgi:hypothetical protein
MGPQKLDVGVNLPLIMALCDRGLHLGDSEWRVLRAGLASDDATMVFEVCVNAALKKANKSVSY